MKLGFIGLGKMGTRMALKLLDENHGVVVWNRSSEGIEKFKSQIDSGVLATASPQNEVTAASERSSHVQNLSLRVAKTIEDLVRGLEKPRVIWLMLPAGEPTESILNEVQKYVYTNDIVIDGGNSHFKDSEKRYQEFKKRGVRFLGIGVSGGIIAAKNGYPLMVGGDKSAYDYVQPILNSLAKPARHAGKALRAGHHGGHEYFGEGGAGHFIKMVHNGIEYGIMQSLAEGFGVLEKAPYKFNLLKIAELWQKGSLVSGFILDRAVEILKKDQKISGVVGSIGASGEADWMVKQAEDEGVSVEIIKRALEYRRRSQTDKEIQNSFTAKLISALRNVFGGHEIKKKS